MYQPAHLHHPALPPPLPGPDNPPREGKRKKSSSSKASKKQKTEGGGGKARGGFAKLVTVSPALAEVLGKEQASRSELTKFFWEYFKTNGLQVGWLCYSRVLSTVVGRGGGLEGWGKELASRSELTRLEMVLRLHPNPSAAGRRMHVQVV